MKRSHGLPAPPHHPVRAGRADGPLLVAARAAVLVPLAAGAVLVALAALFDGTADAMAWVERGLLCAAVAVLVWSVVTAAVRNVGDGELEVTAVFGAVLLMIAAYFTGPVALVAVPGVALVTGVVSAVRTDRAERRQPAGAAGAGRAGAGAPCGEEAA